jgi:hypothetical protein
MPLKRRRQLLLLLLMLLLLPVRLLLSSLMPLPLSPSVTYHRLYPGLLQIAATAHIAAGFRQRAPAAVRTALALLRGLPSSAEVLLLRGVGAVLLGDPTTGVASIKAAALCVMTRHTAAQPPVQLPAIARVIQVNVARPLHSRHS